MTVNNLFIFADKPPANQMDVLASNIACSAALNAAMLRNGVYMLPNVRRFFSAAHTDEDLDVTLTALKKSCREIAQT